MNVYEKLLFRFLLGISPMEIERHTMGVNRILLSLSLSLDKTFSKGQRQLDASFKENIARREKFKSMYRIHIVHRLRKILQNPKIDSVNSMAIDLHNVIIIFLSSLPSMLWL